MLEFFIKEYTPSKGDYFAVKCVGVPHDRSYISDVFLCLETDGVLVVSLSPTHTSYNEDGKRKYVFRVGDYEFTKVGENVLEALGIIKGETNE